MLIGMTCISSCVQKSHKRVVVYTVDVSGIKNIKTVGIRGSQSPLSWDNDSKMEAIVKDSIYKITVVSNTGRICNEFKFSINNKLELQDNNNRKLYFSEKDTTFYNSKFNMLEN